MSKYTIIHNGVYHHGNVIDLGNGDSDTVCAFCGDLCTDKASCGIRYHSIQGSWLNAPNDVRECAEGISLIACCDECYDTYDIGTHGNGPTEIIFNTETRYRFVVDCNFRMND